MLSTLEFNKGIAEIYKICLHFHYFANIPYYIDNKLNTEIKDVKLGLF